MCYYYTKSRQTSGNNLTQLFRNTTDLFRTDYLHIPEESAQLRNNWTLASKIDQERTVLECINHVFLLKDYAKLSQSSSPAMDLQVCDDYAVGNISVCR